MAGCTTIGDHNILRVPPYLVRKREVKKERLETLYIGKVPFHAAEQHRICRKGV